MLLQRPSLVLAAALMGTCLSAGAQEDEPFDGRFYIAPQLSFGFFDDSSIDTTTTTGGLFGGTTTTTEDVDLDNTGGYGIAIGKPLSRYFNLEAYYFRFDDIEMDGSSSEIDQDGYGLTALFFPGTKRSPFFLLAGYAEGDFEVDGSDFEEDTTYYDAGAGFMHKLTDYGLALRGEYRYRHTDVDRFNDEFDNHVVSLSLQIPLGASPTKPQPEPEPEPEPAPEPEPLDSDGDGVIDDNDECPGTPTGTEVDSKGCPVEKAEPIVLEGVQFEFNSAKLTADAERRLDNVVNALQGSPELEVRIEGHTDNIGSDSYNQDLSQQRADSVKRYLVDHGIEPERLTTRGFGESEPVATNDTEAGRAQNRRVELEVTNR